MASFVETHGHAIDEGHFEALYTTYKSDVQRLASYLLKNATDAEDAAQTVFLNVLRALRQGVTPADPRAWLLAITRNVCFSRHRAAAARPVLVELDYDEPAGPTEDGTPSADEIVGALTRLLPNQRTALILRDFRGVSRGEICNLMSLSPVAVEALLTRARTAFREELEAGEQPFACEETRKLVEQQLDGLITVADRHSLRSHLRHCAPCSTLARAVRSSRSKVAGLLFWPFDLISRLAGAFSQAPAVVHVAAAVTSTAAVATIAIPTAVSNSPSLAHVEGRTAPGPVAAAFAASRPVTASRPTPAIAATAPARISTHVALPVSHTTRHPAAKAPSHSRVHSRPAAHASHKAVAHYTTVAAPHAAAPVHIAPATNSGGSVHTYHRPQVTPSTSAGAAPHSSGGVTTPRSSAPRSSSPIVKPTSKPRPKLRPKPRVRPKPRRGAKNRHAPAPLNQMPPSTPPAADLQPSGDGAADAGSGATVGDSKAPAESQSSSTQTSGSSSQSTSASGSGTAGSDAGGNGNGNGNGNANGNGNGNGNGDNGKHKHK